MHEPRQGPEVFWKVGRLPGLQFPLGYDRASLRRQSLGFRQGRESRQLGCLLPHIRPNRKVQGISISPRMDFELKTQSIFLSRGFPLFQICRGVF